MAGLILPYGIKGLASPGPILPIGLSASAATPSFAFASLSTDTALAAGNNDILSASVQVTSLLLVLLELDILSVSPANGANATLLDGASSIFPVNGGNGGALAQPNASESSVNGGHYLFAASAGVHTITLRLVRVGTNVTVKSACLSLWGL